MEQLGGPLALNSEQPDWGWLAGQGEATPQGRLSEALTGHAVRLACGASYCKVAAMSAWIVLLRFLQGRIRPYDAGLGAVGKRSSVRWIYHITCLYFAGHGRRDDQHRQGHQRQGARVVLQPCLGQLLAKPTRPCQVDVWYKL